MYQHSPRWRDLEMLIDATYPHPVGPLRAPSEALYVQAKTCFARVAFAFFIAFLVKRGGKR